MFGVFTCTAGAPVRACEWYRSRFWQSTRAPPPGAADSRNASSGNDEALQMRGKRFRAVLIDSAVSEHLQTTLESLLANAHQSELNLRT